jgi:hypothetical protein
VTAGARWRSRWSGGGAGFAALLLVLGACYPGEITDVEQTDVVLTVHRDTDFSKYSTYSMPDSVVDVCENSGDPECENAIDIDHSYDAEILGQVAAGFESYGYQRIPIDQVDATHLPDVFVLVSVSATERTSVAVWWPWWDWGYWWPGWGPGWGPGYPAVSIKRWEQGTLDISMIDPRDVDPDQQVFRVQWEAVLTGVMSSSGFSTLRVDRGIEQAFDQSTYLSTR